MDPIELRLIEEMITQLKTSPEKKKTMKNYMILTPFKIHRHPGKNKLYVEYLAFQRMSCVKDISPLPYPVSNSDNFSSFS